MTTASPQLRPILIIGSPPWLIDPPGGAPPIAGDLPTSASHKLHVERLAEQEDDAGDGGHRRWQGDACARHTDNLDDRNARCW